MSGRATIRAEVGSMHTVRRAGRAAASGARVVSRASPSFPPRAAPRAARGARRGPGRCAWRSGHRRCAVECREARHFPSESRVRAWNEESSGRGRDLAPGWARARTRASGRDTPSGGVDARAEGDARGEHDHAAGAVARAELCVAKKNRSGVVPVIDSLVDARAPNPVDALEDLSPYLRSPAPSLALP